MENEVWKNIPNYEKLYQASNLGRIRNKKTKNILKGVDTKGYLRITISYKNERKIISKHRLIAMTFIPNPNNYPEVNHIDGNKHNNRVDNLEWCTRQQNAIHSIINGLQKTKDVCQYDLQGNFIKKYFNAEQAQKETKIYHILDCCKGKRKTAGGYIWKYFVD